MRRGRGPQEVQQSPLRLRCVSVLVVLAVVAAVAQAEPRVPAPAVAMEWRGYVQLVLMVPLLWLLSRARVLGVTVPLAVVVGAALAAVVGAVVNYSHVDLGRGAFVVARFEGENDDRQVKIYRDRVRRQVRGAALSLIGSTRERVRSDDDARGVLQHHAHLGGVVWGARRWVRLRLRAPPLRAFSELPAGSFGERLLRASGAPDLKVVTGVSRLGISNGDDPFTVDFIAGLAVVWRQLPERLAWGGGSEPAFEQAVRELGALRGAWSSHAHRAVPLFLSGTYHLLRAVEGARLEGGELGCALGSFEAAALQLRAGDDPELALAIQSNYSVARLVAEYAGQPLRRQPGVVAQMVQRVRPAASRASPEVAAVGTIAKSTRKITGGSYGKKRSKRRRAESAAANGVSGD
jgi:hypothetical protein